MKWELSEIEQLYRLYPELAVQELADLLNRTCNSVKGKIKCLGLKLDPKIKVKRLSENMNKRRAQYQTPNYLFCQVVGVAIDTLIAQSKGIDT